MLMVGWRPWTAPRGENEGNGSFAPRSALCQERGAPDSLANEPAGGVMPKALCPGSPVP
jgi:hypothetical protein